MLKLAALPRPFDGELSEFAGRWLNAPVNRQPDHAQHMRRVAIYLVLIIGLLFLINRQWLRENTLINSPSFDALVYQNQSYDDYLLVRREGLSALVGKYMDGGWHVPPLYMLSGTFLYLVFGRDPANFYVAPAFWLYLFVLGTYGFLHYWTRRTAWAILGAALVLTVHSVVAVGLRVSQTDFSVGAAYTWAMYVLVASDGLKSRGGAALYALSVSACVLLKSSIVPYFLAPGLIWLMYVVGDPANRMRRLQNAGLVVVGVVALTGWFFFSNYRQIIAYYTRWGGELSQVSREAAGIRSVADELTFYLRSFADFHLGGRNLPLYLLTLLLAAASCMLVTLRSALLRTKGSLVERRAWFGLATACIWLAVPYLILSLYASKAYSVDFPFLAVFYVIPVMLAAIAFRGRFALLGVIIFVPLVLLQTRDQVQVLVQDQPAGNWHEQAILDDIAQDADARGLREIAVSNAFVDRHLTSENLRYFVVNGTFSRLQGRYKVLPLQHYFEADKYYRFLLGADYILAKTGGYEPSQHPNNLVAPAVNQALATSPGLFPLGRYDMPDGTQLIVYRNESRSVIDYPAPASDGWIGPRFPVTFRGPARDRHLRLSGQILLPPGLPYPAHVFLEDERGEVVTDRVPVPDEGPFDLSLTIPASALAAGGTTTLYLMSDRPYRPVDHGVSADARELLMILTAMDEAGP